MIPVEERSSGRNIATFRLNFSTESEYAMPKQDIPYAIKSLPPFPDTALKAIRALQDPGNSARDIVDIVQYDENITANLLRLINSAQFGLARKVDSLQQAVAYLGSRAILEILLISGTLSYFDSDLTGYQTTGLQLWRHSVSCAVACRYLSQKIAPDQSATLFTAGLLHDIGKIVLNSYLQDRYTEITKMVEDEKQLTLIQAERETLGVDHAQVGGEIAQKWGFPPAIATCMALHHEPETAEPGDAMTDVVFLADKIGNLIAGVRGADQWSFSRIKAALDRRKLSFDDLDRAMIMVDQSVRHIVNATRN